MAGGQQELSANKQHGLVPMADDIRKDGWEVVTGKKVGGWSEAGRRGVLGSVA